MVAPEFQIMETETITRWSSFVSNALTVDGTEYRVMSERSCKGRTNCVCADHLNWPDVGDTVRLAFKESSQGLLFVEGVEVLEDEEEPATTPPAAAPPGTWQVQTTTHRGPDPVIELHLLRGTALTAAARLANDEDELEDVVADAGRLLSWIQSGVLAPPPPVASPVTPPVTPPVVTPARSHRGTVERVIERGFACKGVQRWWFYVDDYQGMRAAENDRIAFDVDEKDMVTAVREYSG